MIFFFFKKRSFFLFLTVAISMTIHFVSMFRCFSGLSLLKSFISFFFIPTCFFVIETWDPNIWKSCALFLKCAIFTSINCRLEKPMILLSRFRVSQASNTTTFRNYVFVWRPSRMVEENTILHKSLRLIFSFLRCRTIISCWCLGWSLLSLMLTNIPFSFI